MIPRHLQTEMIWTLWGAMLCAVVSLPLGRRLTERTECADNPCLNGGICYLGTLLGERMLSGNNKKQHANRIDDSRPFGLPFNMGVGWLVDGLLRPWHSGVAGGFEGVDADKGPVWSCECEPGFKGRLCRSSSSASGSASPASHGVSKDLSPKLEGQEKQVPAPGGADGGFEFEPDRTHAGHAVLTGLTQANTLGSEDDAGIGAVTLQNAAAGLFSSHPQSEPRTAAAAAAGGPNPCNVPKRFRKGPCLTRSDSGPASVRRAPEHPPAEPSASPTSSAAPHPLGSKQGKRNAPKPPKASIVLSQGRFYLLLLTHVLVDLAMGW